MPAKPSPADATARLSPVPRAAGRRRRRWPLLLLLILLLAAGAQAAAWAWMTGQLESGLQDWAAERRAAGWQVAHGPPQRGGWPLAVTVIVPDVVLRGEGFGWQAERVVLSLVPPGFARLRITADGRQAVESPAGSAPMQAEGLAMELPLAADAMGIAGLPRDAGMRADRIRLDLPAGPLALSGVRLDLGTGDGRADTPLATLRGQAAMVTLPSALAAQPGLAVLGPTLDRVSLDAVLGGPWPGLGGTPAAGAQRWRDGGGSLAVRELGLGWGAARATATADITLDEALQPKGDGMLHLSGGASVLAAAREARLVGQRETAAAQVLLAMMQRPAPEGGPPRLDLPMVLERRTLSLGGMPLLRLPAWSWPGAPR